jgi:glycosyltransferase involved in cell wall biosynthesis
MKKVVFVHRVTCDYSRSFLVQLHEKLKEENIEFIVVSGSPWTNEGLKDIVDELPFGRRCKNIRLIGNAYYSFGAIKHLKDIDLLIAEQLSASLHLYLFLLKRFGDITKSRIFGNRRKRLFAYYGHGSTLNKGIAASIMGPWKKFISRQADWWFAYNEMSAGIVKAFRFPQDKITVFQNATDTSELKKTALQLKANDLVNLYEQLFQGFTDEGFEKKFIGVFVSRLIPSKLIPFLLESLDIIQKQCSSFKIIFIGDGPQADMIDEFCRKRKWAVWVGAKHGTEKVKYIALADMWLNPGPLGLAIVDSFSLGVPLITTDCKGHGPEIDYLRNYGNGVILPLDINLYAKGIIEIYSNKELLGNLKKEASIDGKKYTIEEMVARFSRGVHNCFTQVDN